MSARPPSEVPTAIGMSRKPACEMLEYASNRFTFVCTRAPRFPHASEMQTITASEIVQRFSSDGNAVTSRRIVRTSAAIFVAADMNAVTGVGAPW
jgi:hypothetical protein